jgi:hypothetical protein
MLTDIRALGSDRINRGGFSGQQYCPELLTPLNNRVPFSRGIRGEELVVGPVEDLYPEISAVVVEGLSIHLSSFTIVN